MQHKFTEKEKIILQAISLVIKERLSVLNKSQRLLGYENGVQPSFISMNQKYSVFGSCLML